MNNTVEAQHTDTLMKEIDLVQNCISRMAQYSFIVKGWTISMVAALLALTPQKTNIKLLCIVCFVLTGCFWYLDATFLKTEKLYCRKYKWIITNRGSTSEFSFDLDPNAIHLLEYKSYRPWHTVGDSNRNSYCQL